MTAEHKSEERRLIIGPQTKNLQVGDKIVVVEPSVRRIIVEKVHESGELDVEIHNLIEDSRSVAPMMLGTPVVIREGI